MVRYRLWVLTGVICVVCLVLAYVLGPFAPKRPAPAMAFYHWKTEYNPSPEDKDFLAKAGASRLYLRLFDVVSVNFGDPEPVATVVFKQKPDLPVTPVVYITNEAMSNIDTFCNTSTYAELIVRRAMAVVLGNELNATKELQIDCDWSEKTRDSFFAMLTAMRKHLPADWQLSVTLRLYQFRYPGKAGVPPADRVALMVYNMGNLRQAGEHNSIIDAKIAAQYLDGVQPYPLPMDLALPLFSWGVLFDASNTYKGLIRAVPQELMDYDTGKVALDAAHPVWKQTGPHIYTLRQDLRLADQKIPAGWSLRVERTDAAALKALVKVLRTKIRAEQAVIFYHLDNAILKEWDPNALQRTLSLVH